MTREDSAVASSKTGKSQASYISKFEKYVGPGANVVASVYAPITFGPTIPVLYLQPPTTPDAVPIILGSGTTLRPHANRLIIKRKILTGHPSRIAPSKKARRAVVRFMFNSRQDVEYFSPLPLTTHMGRHGNFVRSSSGLYTDEHVTSGAAVGYTGAFKANFDKQLKSWDVVQLQLFKRAYPKWQDYAHTFGPEVAR